MATASTIEVEVAAFAADIGGDAWDPPLPDDFPTRLDQSVPFSDRPRMKLLVESDETIVSILDRAAESLRVRAHWDQCGKGFLSFDNPGRSAPAYARTLLSVDDHDQLFWRYEWNSVPFERVLRTAELGLLDGNPHRINLVLLPPHGDWHVAWRDLIDFWQHARPAIDDLLRIVGVGALAKSAWELARARIDNGREAIVRRESDLAARGGSPDEMMRLVSTMTASSDVLAAALGINEAEARNLVRLLGTPQATASPEEVEADAILRRLVTVGTVVAHHGDLSEETVQAYLRDCLSWSSDPLLSARLGEWRQVEQQRSVQNETPNMTWSESWEVEDRIRRTALDIVDRHLQRRPRDVKTALQALALLRIQ